MSNLLLDEEPMIVIPKLAAILGGSDRAIILQQLHYWLNKSGKTIDGRRWIYNTMDEWHDQFYWIKSIRTINNHFKKLEEMGLVITGNYNKKGFDRTKWYTIDYDQLHKMENAFCKNCKMEHAKVAVCNEQNLQNPFSKNCVNNTRDYTETTSEITKKNNSQAEPDSVAISVKTIVDYLNEKTDSHYKATTPKTKQLVQARLKEGFSVDDFKTVIDKKTATWMNDNKMNKYLRPLTLFGTKFEDYLNEKVKGQPDKNDPYYTERINPMTGQPDPNGLTRYQMDNEYW